MARIVALIPDLLFGSNVMGALSAAGHDVRLVGSLSEYDLESVAGHAADPTGGEGSGSAAGDALRRTGAELLIVDLTADAPGRLEQVRALGEHRPPVLAFYSHVETDVRALADGAGLERVVPRSRMAREGAALVASLLGARPA